MIVIKDSRHLLRIISQMTGNEYFLLADNEEVLSLLRKLWKPLINQEDGVNLFFQVARLMNVSVLDDFYEYRLVEIDNSDQRLIINNDDSMAYVVDTYRAIVDRF